MLTRPGWLLHLESAALFALSLFIYYANGYRWWLFAALFLLPDLSMLGYLIDVKWGSSFYNLVHTMTGPAIVILFCLIRMNLSLLPYALIWVAHISFDRMLGFGLKYPTQFKDTHLQHV
jgi:Domain of unknown function (DUF4260)